MLNKLLSSEFSSEFIKLNVIVLVSRFVYESHKNNNAIPKKNSLPMMLNQ